MRRILFLLGGFLLLVVGFHIGAQQTDDSTTATGEPVTGLIAFEDAIIYVGPDFAYDIVGQLPLNGSVNVLGRRGVYRYGWNGSQWVEIEFSGRRAWVYARLIRTSVSFNSLPVTGLALPRDRDGRVPDVFDLSHPICDDWPSGYTQTGNFMAGDVEIVVTYPPMTGANVYEVVAVSPTGYRTEFGSETTTAVIELRRLSHEEGIYNWYVAPYWTISTSHWSWQQLCLERYGGAFERPPQGDE